MRHIEYRCLLRKSETYNKKMEMISIYRSSTSYISLLDKDDVVCDTICYIQRRLISDIPLHKQAKTNCSVSGSPASFKTLTGCFSSSAPSFYYHLHAIFEW